MEFPNDFKQPSKQIINEEKKKTTDKLVEFCAADLRAFQVVTGAGFVNLAQHFVSVGARRGDINVSKILPHPTTISRNIPKMKTKKLDEVFPIILKAIDNDECAGTTDGWSDNHKKNCYLSLTVHFFDDDFVLHKKDLFCTPFKDKVKSGANIRKAISQKLHTIGFDAQQFLKIPFVTDRGSNVVKAFKGKKFNRKNCYCHVINTVLANTFDKHTPVQVEILISDCKSIVTFLKQSCKANETTHTPKQEVSTRWNSKLRMINSVIQQYAEIVELLTEDQRKKWSIDVELGKELVRFLEPFKEATDTLEGDKYPTANYILLCKAELKKHLTEGKFVGPVKTLAKYALQYLDMKWPDLMEHKIACFLDPRYRLLKMLTDQERDEVHIEIRKLMKGIPSNGSVDAPPVKKQKLSVYEDIVDNEDDNELQLYIQDANFANSKSGKHLVETFWKENKMKFPKLYLLARRRLCVPASSSSSERMFSGAGKTIDKSRANIDPKILDDLMFLRDKFTKSTV